MIAYATHDNAPNCFGVENCAQCGDAPKTLWEFTSIPGVRVCSEECARAYHTEQHLKTSLR